jgi:signal transduction histidine kinase
LILTTRSASRLVRRLAQAVTSEAMLLNAVSGRTAALLRLTGLGLISWSIFTSPFAPATSGRGLVVLIAWLIAVIAWFVWTFWSSRLDRMTADVYVMAVSGGVLAAADSSSAASAIVFVAATAAAARVGVVQGLIVAAVGAATLAAGAIIYDAGPLGVLAYAAGFATLALAGANLRQVNLRAEQAELLLAQTQRSQEEELRAARLEESTRIARDIHDVLAHSLAGLTIQLEATDALLAHGADVETIRARVQRAHELARDGLRETRRAVGALRGDAPVPVPEAIEQLVAAYDGPVELVCNGDLRRLGGAVGETLVRAVQEALTNVRKHAPGAPVDVSVDVAADEVTVVVSDRPAAAVTASANSGLAGSGGGYGLTGMRERAAQLGGTLAAGPDATGWRVTMCLPLGASA